jgi:hypothetical protein
MKINSFNSLLVAIAALAVSTHARADLLYTFDTDAEGFVAWDWTAGPVGWTGGGAIRSTSTAAGWWLPDPGKEFSWTPGGGVAVQQLEMQALANSGLGRLSFDVLIDGTSFPAVPGGGVWYNVNLVTHSDGAAGWTQHENVIGSDWHNDGDNALYTYHIDQSFSWAGWDPGDTWFKFNPGKNDNPGPFNYWIDNLRLYMVPEPSSFALAALGAAVLMVFRRRK